MLRKEDARLLRGRRPSTEIVRRRLRAFAAFVRLAPAAVIGRRRARRGAVLSDAEVAAWMVTAADRVVGTGT